MTPDRHPIDARPRRTTAIAAVAIACAAMPAHASLLSGDALDTMANVIAWLALIIVPVVLITVFWLVHILPEKIAEKRRHPQLAAIKTLCLLSLFFGGLLWPLAWLWAYTKPVLHKMAYGTDVDEEAHPNEAFTPLQDAGIERHRAAENAAADAPVAQAHGDRPEDVGELKRRIRSLEMALAMANDPRRPRAQNPGDDEE
ncbi:MAG TPA: DUF3302 domain-containing protein [Lysobacter sp.]